MEKTLKKGETFQFIDIYIFVGKEIGSLIVSREEKIIDTTIQYDTKV